MVGRALHGASQIVKGITLDGRNAHFYIKEAIFGVYERLDPALLKDLEFWKDLRHVSLPPHCLPHLPLRIAMHGESSFWILPGCCYLPSRHFISCICFYHFLIFFGCQFC